MAKVESGKTYIGVVEDIQDPKKLGRVKIRVLDVFDKTKLEDIPWANPWKDLAGNEFNLPEVGKVVTVVFENANVNSPEFISSDHFNVNLEKKLSQLSNDDYATMKALIFDHKTQIYVNESEGLKLDHKFNMMNIKDKSIDLDLKDNFAKINLGTANSTQRSILGDNFLNWFDDFVQILMGSKGGPFLGNLGAPVVATPALLGSLQLYQQLKDPKFLSKNVYIVDNENVAKLDRIAEGQKGDTWQSTVEENTLTTKEPVTYTPTPGSTATTFDQPPVDAATASAIPPGSTQSESKPQKIEENPDIKVIKELLKIKKYVLYEDVERLNIVAIRNQCINPRDKYSDQFSDKIYLMWKKEDGNWELKQYMFSTVPGLEFTITDNWLLEKNLAKQEPWINSSGKKMIMKEYARIIGTVNNDPIFKNGLPILVPSQYIDVYYIDKYKGARAMLVTPGASQLVWRDTKVDDPDSFIPDNFENPEKIVPSPLLDNSIKIHLGYPSGQKVGAWSEGSQVFSSAENLNEFFDFCEKHSQKYGNKFTYTLATKADWDEATKTVSGNKTSDPLQTTATQSDATAATQSGTQSQSPTQSATEQAISQNKSEIVDALGDGSLMIDVGVQDVILTGKITTDDISRINDKAITFSIKSQSIPNQWVIFNSDLSYTTPAGSKTDLSITEVKPDSAYFDLRSIINPKNSIGDYKVDIRLYFFRKDDFSQRYMSKSVSFSLSQGSSSTSPENIGTTNTSGSTGTASNSGGNQSSNSSSTEYIIGVINPKTPEGKKISGNIKFTKEGPYITAIGTVNNLPTITNGVVNWQDGTRTLGPIVGEKNSSTTVTKDQLADYMINRLISTIESEYQSTINLGIIDKKE